MQTPDETAFTTLLDAWNHHQALRSAHADVRDLFTSRARLDAARDAVRRAAGSDQRTRSAATP